MTSGSIFLFNIYFNKKRKLFLQSLNIHLVSIKLETYLIQHVTRVLSFDSIKGSYPSFWNIEKGIFAKDMGFALILTMMGIPISSTTHPWYS